MFTKDKIINYILKKGKKAKSEKIVNKIMKELQKHSKKPIKKLMQLLIILISVIFKIRTIPNKKQTFRMKPIFIENQTKIFFFALKLIVAKAKTNYFNSLHNKLKEEIFSTTQLKKNSSIRELEKQALNKKHLLKYYRWT